MRKIAENQRGLELVWIKKGEDYPGTEYITDKQGFWIIGNGLYQYVGPNMPNQFELNMYEFEPIEKIKQE